MRVYTRLYMDMCAHVRALNIERVEIFLGHDEMLSTALLAALFIPTRTPKRTKDSASTPALAGLAKPWMSVRPPVYCAPRPACPPTTRPLHFWGGRLHM